ncbi:MAG: hypothetical protein JW816_01180 [Candidatus Buchananbacteria bacterium]|nr:hypothetical protein [Candidatus Buchananbacteria bacterium]
MIKTLISVIAVVLIIILQVSFLSAWPMPVRALNLFLAVIILLTNITNLKTALAWGFGGGLLLEIYTVGFFGLVTISIITTIFFINFLSQYFFTNRSFYSMIGLGLVGTAFYNLLFFVILWSIDFFSLNANTILFDLNYLSFVVWQILLNSLVIAIIFRIYQLVNNRWVLK